MRQSDVEGGKMRIAIVEDHVLIGDCLSTVLRLMGHKVLLPRLWSVDEMTATLSTFRPHIVLLDLDLGPWGRGTPLIRPATDLGAQVVIMSGITDEWEIGRALSLGAAGLVPKTGSLDDLIDRVLVAAAGGQIMDRSERDRFTRAWRTHQEIKGDDRRALAALSPKEAEVLADLMEGRSVTRIAASRFNSEATVRTHVRGILVKLGVKSQLEAVALATRAGWTPHSHAHG